MDSLYLIFVVLIFAAVLLLLIGAYMSWNNGAGSGAQRVARRLREMHNDTQDSPYAVSIIKQRVLSADPARHALMARFPLLAALDRVPLQAGSSWNLAQVLGASVGLALGGMLAGVFVGMAWWLLPLPLLIGAAAPWMLLSGKARRRLERIDLQLPDALDMMGRAMRAGHALPTALRMVADEMQDPLAGEFATLFDEVNFGVAMPDALMNLADRVPSSDLRYFVVAVLIQRETGGNLTELLGSISRVTRERIKLLGDVRTLSAEGRLSALILCLLPFGAGGMSYLVNPGPTEMMINDPTGRTMLSVAAGMMVLGVLLIRQLIRIRV